MLKNAIFMEKSVKIASASGALHPNPRLPPAAGGSAPSPRVVTPASYCYNFVESVSSTKCVCNLQKKKKNNYIKCSAFASFALLHLLFTSNSVVCVDGERKNVSCPRAQSDLATPLLLK